MLSKPNVKEVMPKVGNRYQSVLAKKKIKNAKTNVKNVYTMQ